MNEKIEKIRVSKVEKMFTLAKDNEDNVRIVLGNKVVSNKKFKTFEDADKYIGHKPWELIVNCTLVVIEYHNDLKKNETTEETEVVPEESKE